MVGIYAEDVISEIELAPVTFNLFYGLVRKIVSHWHC
jgi:hypothetical protein